MPDISTDIMPRSITFIFAPFHNLLVLFQYAMLIRIRYYGRNKHFIYISTRYVLPYVG